MAAQNIRLSIEGTSAQETQIIDSISYPPTHSEFASLLKAVDTLKHTLLTSGYFDLKDAPNPIITDSTYTTKLALGKRYDQLRLKLDRSAALREYLKEQRITVANDMIVVKTAFAKALLNNLTLTAANRGKPFSTFRIKNLSKQNDSILSGLLTIQEDTTRYINDIIVEGYQKMPPNFIKRYAGIKKGNPFNRQKLLEQQASLNNLPFVSVKRDLDLQFTRDSTNLYLYLERQRTNSFDGFLGFSTDETTNALKLDGYLDLVLTNNLNYGESLALNYKSDGDDQSQLKVRAELPYLFGSPIGVQAELYLFRKDTTFSETTQQASIFYQVNARTRLQTGYKRKTSDNLLDANVSMPDVQDYQSNRFTAGFSYQVPQNSILFPERRFLDIQGEVGRRTTDLEALDQQGIHATARNIFFLNDKNSIFLQSVTQALFSSTYVTNELSRFGGITSIRGFEENSIFANLYTVLNTEYRYTLNTNLYVHSIIDAAYFENDILDTQNKLISFGVGAGLRTKAGLFKINFANGKNDGQEFRFANTKVHLQLIAQF